MFNLESYTWIIYQGFPLQTKTDGSTYKYTECPRCLAQKKTVAQHGYFVILDRTYGTLHYLLRSAFWTTNILPGMYAQNKKINKSFLLYSMLANKNFLFDQKRLLWLWSTAYSSWHIKCMLGLLSFFHELTIRGRIVFQMTPLFLVYVGQRKV